MTNKQTSDLHMSDDIIFIIVYLAIFALCHALAFKGVVRRWPTNYRDWLPYE